MNFYIKDFFSKCDQIRRKLRIWSYSLKKFLMENFIFCAVIKQKNYSVNSLFFTTSVIEGSERPKLKNCTVEEVSARKKT